MQAKIRAVHFSLDDSVCDHIDARLKRIDYAAGYIVDLAVTLTLDARRFDAEGRVHFRWGATKNVAAHSHDVLEAADQLVEKLVTVVAKEKDKLKSSHARHGPSAETAAER